MIGISMFSSGGISEYYLNNINIKIVLANEIIDKRADFYNSMYPEAKMIVGDIMDDKIFNDYIKKAKIYNPKFLIATPPCQGMSTLGKKEYQKDERNYLFYRIINVINQLNLDYIIVENVPKFFKLNYPYKGQLYNIIDIFKSEFKNKYIVEGNIYNAKDYEVPQSRPRAIIKLYKRGSVWNSPIKNEEISLRKAIGHLPSLSPGDSSKYKYHTAIKHSEMQINAMLNTPEGSSAMKNTIHYPKKKNGQKVRGFHNTYKRMKWDSPCPARATNNGLISGHNNVHPGRSLGDGKWSDPRVLTLLELFIVSSLPEYFKYPTHFKDSFLRLLIGEAIPPRMLFNIVRTINK